MSLIIGSTGARQLPDELVNNSRVKYVDSKPTDSPLAGMVGEKAVFRGDTDRVMKEASQAIQNGKARPIHFDTVEISTEAKAQARAQNEAADAWQAELKQQKAMFKSDKEHLMWAIEQCLNGNQVIPDYPGVARMPTEPKRMEGESDEAWTRRQINYETSFSWAEQWIKTATASMDMPLGESLRYQKEQNAMWASDLMKNSPAMFREWLERSVKPHVERGNFDAAVVPKGFTVADFNQWMSKDVLDYLD